MAEMRVEMDSAETKAFLTILPAEEEDGLPPSQDEVMQALRAANVVHGVNSAAIAHLLKENAPGKRYLVAEATPPQQGPSAVIDFHFRREFSMRPKELEGGRVDYRTLDLFESVTEGQLLVTRTPPGPGVPGSTITGRELQALPGKNTPLPKGKKVRISDDETALYAACGGMVVYVRGQVNVSDLYHIDGDADMKVGNINFDGSVIITGHVISGLTIQATGNIEVGGVVEAANLIANGNIVLRHGMQGMNKGRLEAGGSITANYIERATVVAGGSITANSIAHCNLETGDCLYLSGQNGSLAGGNCRVMNALFARTLGSVTETPTEVEIGLVPQKRVRIGYLQLELKRLPDALNKLQLADYYLKRNPSTDPQRQEMAVSVAAQLKQHQELLREYSEELDQLNEEAEQAIHGKAHISDTAWPGLRLTIASASYRLNTPTSHCSFYLADGEITFGVYEG